MHLLQKEAGPVNLRRRLLCASAVGIPFVFLLPRAVAWDEQRLQALMEQRAGTPGLRRLNAWLELLVRQKSQAQSVQIKAVNDFWNTEVLAALDSSIWKMPDYWATPLQTLAKGAGDCEDFVIGKYFSLIKLGVPFKKMRLIYVRARNGGLGSQRDVAHMVLGIYETPTSDPLVLDNLIDGIKPASQRQDLSPVFSFDAESVYVGGVGTAAASRINRWQDLLMRMRQEGFDV